MRECLRTSAAWRRPGLRRSASPDGRRQDWRVLLARLRTFESWRLQVRRQWADPSGEPWVERPGQERQYTSAALRLLVLHRSACLGGGRAVGELVPARSSHPFESDGSERWAARACCVTRQEHRRFAWELAVEEPRAVMTTAQEAQVRGPRQAEVGKQGQGPVRAAGRPAEVPVWADGKSWRVLRGRPCDRPRQLGCTSGWPGCR